MKVMTGKLISKLEAATRQLDTAISLWFSGGDIISIHTLACSAYQIIHDINRKKGYRDLLYDSVVVKDEYRREMINLLKGDYNFFKHAEKDPDQLIEFDGSKTETFILFSLFGLEMLGVKHNDIRGAFIIWYAINNPDSLTEKGTKKYINNIPAETIAQIRRVSRNEFFDSYILLRRQRKVP
jgi:hypothetical protein